MLDINLIRKNPEEVKEGIRNKGINPKLVDDFLALDEEWRKLTREVDNLRSDQKKLSDARNIEEATKIKDKLQLLERDLTQLESNRNETLSGIPNPPLESVPIGKNESENVVIKEVGEKPQFDFKPQDHVELGKSLDIIDFESGSKVVGSGFYYLKNKGVLLELGLVRYALDFLSKNGFELLFVPDLARDKFYLGTGYQPRGPEAQTYEIKDSDLGLIATAEVSLAGIHADDILAEKDLPKRYAGYSHCFRQEAGSYGKYSKGLYRVHQFTKVEMFVYAKPEESKKIHEELLSLEEKLWQGLDIPYRVLEMCTGDLGSQAARKFDLEAWMPGRGDWGEITSTSNTTDYQARRLNIKLRRKDGKIEFAIAILENYQTKDGTVKIPKVLQPYLGFDEIK
ncbi:serine--tRNA ligase [Candidatus Wolfebacteria bacterium]|nr:serine--tRNA ligase [Candidatus Wolfebacteria bacterium]